MNSDILALAIATGDIVLKSTLLLAFAWCATRLARHSPAAVRNMIWLLALGSILCVPLLEFVSPPNAIVSFVPTRPAPTAIPESMPTAPIVLSSIPDDLPIQAASAPRVEIGDSASPIPPPPASPRTLVTLAGAAWVGGGLVVLLSSALGWIALRRIKASAYEFPSDLPTASQVRKVKLLLSLEKRPPSALTWGALRPTILLPNSAEFWPDHRLQTVLLHELEHVRRWDAAKQFVGLAACALYWFNPFVWLAAKAARAEAEAATDDAVLRAGVKPSTYANTLMDLAAEIGRHQRIKTSAGVAFMKHSKIEARVRAILDTRVRRGVSRWETLVATAVAFTALASLSVVRAAAARPFADLPTVSAQEVTIQEQTPAQKHAAALHAKHLRAIAAKLRKQEKQYATAVLRVQHLQSNIEQLQQKLGKPKPKVAMWKVVADGGKPMPAQIIEDQRQLATLQKQLAEAVALKTQALTNVQTNGTAALQVTKTLASQTALIGEENKRAAESQRQKALADALVRGDAGKASDQQARAILLQDHRAAELVKVLTSQDTARDKQGVDKATQERERARAVVAQADAELRAVQTAKKSADAGVAVALRSLAAQDSAKQSLRQAEMDLRVLDAHSLAKLDDRVADKYDRERLYARLKKLSAERSNPSPAAIATKIRLLKAKLASGQLKGTELKHTKLELEKLSLLRRLSEIELELKNSSAK